MPQGINLKEGARRYAKNSIRAFIKGGKYARDGKPRGIAWLLGVIRESGVDGGELVKIFSELSVFLMDADEKARFEEAKRRVEKNEK